MFICQKFHGCSHFDVLMFCIVLSFCGSFYIHNWWTTSSTKSHKPLQVGGPKNTGVFSTGWEARQADNRCETLRLGYQKCFNKCWAQCWNTILDTYYILDCFELFFVTFDYFFGSQCLRKYMIKHEMTWPVLYLFGAKTVRKTQVFHGSLRTICQFRMVIPHRLFFGPWLCSGTRNTSSTGTSSLESWGGKHFFVLTWWFLLLTWCFFVDLVVWLYHVVIQPARFCT